MQTKKDIDQEKKKVVLHDEDEVAVFRLDIASEFVLQIYRNLASYWWWDGLNIKAQVDQDPSNPNQYNLHQTEESGEYDPLKYPRKPRKLGYLVITRVDNDNHKPVDVKLICSWSSVLSFWKELESILKREYLIIEPKQNDSDSKEDENKNQLKEIYVPGRFADLDRWKKLYKRIKGFSEMSYEAISVKIRDDERLKHLPSSPDTIAKVIRAGKEGLLD